MGFRRNIFSNKISEENMQLKKDGERMIVSEYANNKEDYIIYLIHKLTYDYALQFVQDKIVLDFGCGSGYGSASIADSCKHIIGIDISEEAIDYAKSNYQNERLSFQLIKDTNIEKLPFPENSFDTVLSFQVVEHVRNTDAYFSEIHRVLRPDGYFLIATPNRETRLYKFQKPWNQWHLTEYSAGNLSKALHKNFKTVQILNIGGETDIVRYELNRTKKIRILTLPFTLPFIPEYFRIKGLTFLKSINTFRQKFSHKTKEDLIVSKCPSDFFAISESTRNVLDLIGIAKK